MADSGEGRFAQGYGSVHYPKAERSRDVEADFALAFVLDTAGRAEYESVSLIGNPAPAFLEESCRMLRNARFTPVWRDGAKRRALIVSEMSFKIEPHRPGPYLPPARPKVEALRRGFAEKGMARTAEELSARRHCP
jgi:hypothetical protein